MENPLHATTHTTTASDAIAAVEQAYAAATGQWTGRTWDDGDRLTPEMSDEQIARYLDRCEGEDETPRITSWGHTTQAWRRGAAAAIAERDFARIRELAQQSDDGVAAEAQRAEDAAARAIAAARIGDWSTALRSSAEAAALERQFGDTPTWGPFATAVEAAAEEALCAVVADQRDLFGAQPEPHPRRAPRQPALAAGSRVGAEALAALRRAVVGHDHVDLGAVQDPRFKLSRSVYEEAAAVLETVGAKWHTGRKRHVFTESWDPDMFADVLETGEAPPANPLAYFATPRAVADDMLRQRQVAAALHYLGRCVVLEPSAGTGVLAVATAHAWAEWVRGVSEGDYIERLNADTTHDYTPTLHLVLVELDARRARALGARVKPQIEAIMPGKITAEIIVGDFLTFSREQLGEPRVVMMNPPFSVAGDKRAWWTHLQHALRVVHPVRGGVGCIMPPAFRCSTREDMPAALAMVSRGTAWPLPSGAFKSAGTDIATWALTINAAEAAEPEADTAALVIESTGEMVQQLEKAAEAARAWGRPRFDDPNDPWMRLVLEMSRTVALGETGGRVPHDRQRGGDPVSFTCEWQRRLARILWARYEDGGVS